MSEGIFKSGFVSIIGAPNAGKSTLVNAILNQKLSIVSRKPQTTRHKITGILSDEKSQIVFLDTPGLLEPKYLLHEVMMKSAMSTIDDADIILLVIDVKRFEEELNTAEIKSALQKISKLKSNIFLLINKIDSINKDALIPLIIKANEVFNFNEVIPISGLENLNTKHLVEVILKYLPVHPAYYPLEDISDANEKFFVSEIIREKIFKLFKKEIPYSTTVQITEFYEREKKKFYISADIIVERDSQKGILIGVGGEMLRKVGEISRYDIEKLLNHKVYLKLFVKVEKDWKQNKKGLRELGYN